MNFCKQIRYKKVQNNNKYHHIDKVLIQCRDYIYNTNYNTYECGLGSIDKFPKGDKHLFNLFNFLCFHKGIHFIVCGW